MLSPKSLRFVCDVDQTHRLYKGEAQMKYTLSVLVENQPGVLSKVSAYFHAVVLNTDSLAVGVRQGRPCYLSYHHCGGRR